MKQELRSEYLTMRAEQDIKYLQTASKFIANRLMTLSCYRSAHTIMTYASIGYEVDTFYAIDNMLFDMKTVCLPLCNTNDLTMEPCFLPSVSELCEGAYNIPVPKKKKIIEKDKIDICIVPGLVFGKNMHRLGYGKGYYDRFLKDINAVKVGFCYNFALIDDVPTDENDIPMDIIITENQTLFAK